MPSIETASTEVLLNSFGPVSSNSPILFQVFPRSGNPGPPGPWSPAATWSSLSEYESPFSPPSPMQIIQEPSPSWPGRIKLLVPAQRVTPLPWRRHLRPLWRLSPVPPLGRSRAARPRAHPLPARASRGHAPASEKAATLAHWAPPLAAIRAAAAR